MASVNPPVNGVAFIVYLGLRSQADTKLYQANPTIASGDFKVSIDGGALANLATLPTVTPASGKMVKISLSAAEMTGDNITVVCSDAAGAEWCDQIINIQTTYGVGTALVFRGTAASGAAGSVTMASPLLTTADYYNGMTAEIVGGTGVGQARQVYDSNATSRQLDVSPSWAVNPDNTSVVELYGTPPSGIVAASVPVVTLFGNAGIKKNVALAGFPFQMTDATLHTPKTGLTVTATRSLDGAAFAACANAVSEVANGWYKISLAAADLNGDTVALKFTATGADATNITIVTGT